MATTSHGHHIPGTVPDAERPEKVMRCGGVHLCKTCQSEAAQYHNTDQKDIHMETAASTSPVKTLDKRKFVRRTFEVEAVQVTEENFKEVAKWCGGRIVTVQDLANEVVKEEVDESGKSLGSVERPSEKHIAVEVARPLNRRQTEAYVGDWILFASNGFKVYTSRPFRKNFVEVNANSSDDVKVAAELAAASEQDHEAQALIRRQAVIIGQKDDLIQQLQNRLNELEPTTEIMTSAVPAETTQ